MLYEDPGDRKNVTGGYLNVRGVAMAVLIEGISVVTRRNAIQTKLRGGWEAFLKLVPNRTLCTDGLLARVGFMSPDGVHEFVQSLEKLGLTYLDETRVAMDFSVVDMLTGPTMKTPWLEFAKLNFEFVKGASDRKVSACWLFEGLRDKGAGIYLSGSSIDLAVPEGWTYEDSLTEKHTFVLTQKR